MNDEIIQIMKYRKLTENEIGAVLCRIQWGLTFTEIAKDMGVTPSRARQIYLKALLKLRHAETIKILHQELR